MSKKVLIPTKLDEAVSKILKQHGFEPVQDAEAEISALCKAHPDTLAMIVRSEKVTAAVIDSLPKLRVVVRAGAGYDNIDVKHARRKDVDVMNTPGANSNAVAEEVVALILAAYRQIVQADRGTREGLWEKNKLMGRELAGKTVGIIGLGNIGQTLVKRLGGFECRILAYDPVVSGERAAELGVELCPSLDQIFSQADIVSLHIPETDETRGLVGAKYLGLMKKGSMIVNCARSGVINEDDLRKQKKEKNLIFCNDVYKKDEPGPKSTADIADIMMPHLGASTKEANLKAATQAADELVDYFERGVVRFVVNRGIPEGLDPSYQKLVFHLTRLASAYLGSDKQPSRIEATFYGDLKQYETWLLGPIVLGLSMDFDPLFDYMEAAHYLEEKGISFQSREVDNSKGYGNTVTLDLMEGSGREFTRVSIRGTLTEGNLAVSRIDDFDKLYFEPFGNITLVVYRDQPGMLSQITGAFARKEINIDEIRSSFDARSGNSLAVLKLNRPAEKEILEGILGCPGFKKAVYLSL